MTTGEKGSRFSTSWKYWSGGDRNPWEPKDYGQNPHYYVMLSAKRNLATPWRDFYGMRRWSNFVSEQNPICTSIDNYLVGKIRGVASQQQYLADLYEAKSAVDLVNTNLQRLLKLAKGIKKLPKKVFKGVLKLYSFKPKAKRGKGPRKNRKKVPNYDLSAIPSAWLEFWFAAAPTLGSVEGLIDTFNVPFEWENFRFTTPKEELQWYEGNTYCKYNISARARGDLRVKNHNVGIIDRMGLRNNWSTVWEIAPWSWAIDYFANVGECFANLDGMFDNFEFRRLSTSYIVESHVIRPVYQGDMSRHEISDGFSLERWPRVPLESRFQFQMGPGLKQCSYLLSAISLTLKGKLA